MLEASGICFRYPSGWQLGPVDLAVRRGEVTALVGPNGAGKTTLMRILAGLILPSSGVIRLDGDPVTDRWLLARRVALTPSEPAFPRGCRVRDLARLRLRSVRLNGAEAEAFLHHLAGRLGRPLMTRPHALSRGQRLTLALELALAGMPEVVVSDEPWAGLDPLAVEQLLERLKALAARGAVVLVSSHDLLALPMVARRFVFLIGGRVRAAGTLEELRSLSPCPEGDPPQVLRELYRALVSEEPR